MDKCVINTFYHPIVLHSNSLTCIYKYKLMETTQYFLRINWPFWSYREGDTVPTFFTEGQRPNKNHPHTPLLIPHVFSWQVNKGKITLRIILTTNAKQRIENNGSTWECLCTQILTPDFSTLLILTIVNLSK